MFPCELISMPASTALRFTAELVTGTKGICESHVGSSSRNKWDMVVLPTKTASYISFRLMSAFEAASWMISLTTTFIFSVMSWLPFWFSITCLIRDIVSSPKTTCALSCEEYESSRPVIRSIIVPTTVVVPMSIAIPYCRLVVFPGSISMIRSFAVTTVTLY